MRILSITAQKPFATGSGIYLTELVRVFRKKGISQAVVAGIYEGEKSPFPEDVEFYPLYFKTGQLPFPIPGMSDEMPYESTRYCDMTEEMQEQYETAFISHIERAVQNFNPDLILCHHLYFLTALVRRHFPMHRVYGFCHNTDIRQMDKHSIKRQLILDNIGKLDRIFAPQDKQAEGVCRVYGVKPEDITLVGVGYNSELFFPPKGKIRDGVCRLLFAGKISEKKGVFSLLRAMKRLEMPEDRLELTLAGGAGNREEYDAICALSRELPYRILFSGKLNQQELADAYRRADVFVLPSFYDAIPLTTIEALACGTRLVVSELPGIREFYEAHIKGGSIRYVTLPDMINGDEPVQEQLPLFEKRLSEALRDSIEELSEEYADVSSLSWELIAEEVLH